MFIDRTEELAAMNKWYEEGKAEMILMYGRRRAGKTRLLQEFMKGKPSLYFMADVSASILEVFGKSLKDRFVRFSTWDDFFDFLEIEAKEKRIVVAIDEFQYLCDANRAWPTILQRRWESLKKTRIMLILCGSIVSSIYRIAMGYGSALYGRKTREMEILPMGFIDARELLPSYSPEDAAYAYAILGGVPRYLEEFDDGKNLYENISDRILDKNAFLYREPINLFYEEFKKPTVYLSILSALAEGAKKFGELSDLARVPTNKLPKYLSVLERVKIVERRAPVTEKRARTRNTRYELSDNFMRFFFKFVYPERSTTELGEKGPALERIKRELDSFAGRAFEKMSEQFLIKRKPVPFTRIGRWWDKSGEIDIVSLNEPGKSAAFFECKWRDVGEKEALKILEGLKEKAKSVQWRSEKRKEKYGIIARRIDGKEKLRKRGWLAYDLEDFV